MQSQNVIQHVLLVILLLCGYFYLFHLAARRTTNKTALPLIAVVLLAVYLMIMVPTTIIISSFGSFSTMLISFLLLFACVVLFSGIYVLIRDRGSIRWGMLILFILYVVAIGYITIFSRDGSSNDTSVLLSFDSIKEALDTRSLEPVNHLFLNTVMFIPVGVLLPSVYPARFNGIGIAAMIGLMLSMLIEATQMFLGIGQCDVEDLLGNTLGAVIGMLLYKLYLRMRPDRR